MVRIQENVPLASHTTFGIGGPAKYFAEAESAEEIVECCKWANPPTGGLPIFVLGGGSNVLISDKGFNGLVVKVQSSKFKVQSSALEVEAGVPLAKIVSEAVSAGLSGLEWAIGIPGTVGGAVCGNAGAFGKETADNLESVKALDLEDLSVKEFKKSECGFCYRDSMFKNNRDWIILEAVFKLEKGEPAEIKEVMKDCVKQRERSFGSGQKCAGSFFKNIEWERSDINKSEFIKKYLEIEQFKDKSKIAAGFLIDFFGFKGKKIGGAMVSNEHANFIVNTGNATAEDVVSLAALIKEKISSRYGFNLEEEVCMVGF